MQSGFLKVILICLLASFFANQADAQLLHEINKLKTEKRKSKGFRVFKKEVRRGSGKTQVINVGSPRFTKASKKRGYNVATRYSQSIAGQGSFRVVTPKYSRDIAGRGSSRVVNPKFSKDIAGKGFKGSVNPRFSRDPENFGSYRAWKPRTVSDRSMVFSFPRVQHYIKRPQNQGEEFYNPKYSDKSKKGGRDFHPSSAYRSAKYKNSKLLRESLQKFNILLVRVHGNKTQPDGVYKKSKKLKYDKHETEIWNNKEREYSHN